jgi:death on curing protein
MVRIRFLSESAIIWMHEYMIRSYGGRPGILNSSALSSAVSGPQWRWKYLNSTILELAAAYAFYLVKDHAFVDGNKRTARMAMIVFLKYHGIKIIVTEDALLESILDIESGKMSREELAVWLQTATSDH